MDAFISDDACLWVLFAAVGYYASRRISSQLHQIRLAVQITNPEPLPEMISQFTEDAISVRSLEQLSKSPNYHVREACSNIVRARSIQSKDTSPAIVTLLNSATQSDRRKGLLMLRFLNSKDPCIFWPLQIRQAFLNCLICMLPCAWQAWRDRTHVPTELILAIEMLRDVINERPRHIIDGFVTAGLVSLWLSKFPLCDASSAPESATSTKTQPSPDLKFVSHLMRHKSGNLCHSFAFCQIIAILQRLPLGRNQMIQYHLLHREEPEPSRQTRSHSSIEESPEEQSLRRRRREAIVMGEQGRAIRSDDIIQRGEDVHDEELEELEQMWLRSSDHELSLY